jgi:hypothetical protein
MIMQLKPSGADSLRKMNDTFSDSNRKFADNVGTVDDLRFIIFDNDTHLLSAGAKKSGHD